MGKVDDEQPLPSTPLDAQGISPAVGSSHSCCLSCSKLRKSVNFRCFFALVLGVAVLSSAVFWLPFFRFGHRKDLDLDFAGHDIVASFTLRKPASFLEEHILQLQGDIFDEMSFSSVKVGIIAVEPSAEPNKTKVVFAVESDLTTQSLIRDSFMDIISNTSVLHLTTASLFGDPFSFELLKFRGGITASPEQKAFLMQSGQIRFNFTLNFCIDQILRNFDQLRSQLRTGLQLAPYENLYMSLTNSKGSTVDPPTTVESKVLLAVGINYSESRIKQLARTITGSHSKNLGLNNTVFGRVKQVRLSSTLLHSLASSVPSPSPSPSPSLASPHISLSPSVGSPKSAAPTPEKNKEAAPPACNLGNGNKFLYTAPSPAPVYTPNAAPLQPAHTQAPPLKLPPAPAPTQPHIAYAPTHPPYARPPIARGTPHVVKHLS